MSIDFSLMDGSLPGRELYLQWLYDIAEQYKYLPVLSQRIDIEIKRASKEIERMKLAGC